MISNDFVLFFCQLYPDTFFTKFYNANGEIVEEEGTMYIIC